MVPPKLFVVTRLKLHLISRHGGGVCEAVGSAAPVLDWHRHARSGCFLSPSKGTPKGFPLPSRTRQGRHRAAAVPPPCGAPTHFWVQIGSKNVPQKNRKTDLGKKSPKEPQWPNLGPKLCQNCSKTVPQKRHVWQMANIDSGCYLLYFVYIWGPQVALKTASKSHLTKKQLQSSTNPIIC